MTNCKLRRASDGTGVLRIPHVFPLTSVCSTLEPDSVLYFEWLGRPLFADRRREEMLHESHRSGWVCTADRDRLTRVIDLLRVCPELRLGVNISGASAADRALWGRVLADLEADRSLAQRLVLEIDEGESIELGLGAVFVRRIQWLGCQVALDHFGRRYGVDAGAAILAPDIIKIDGAFVRTAMNDALVLRQLKGLIQLAQDCARHVVVLGVRTAADARLALSVGATWVQANS